MKKAYNEAETQDERDHVKTIATACGISPREWDADICARREAIHADAPLETLYALFEGLNETEKELYFTHILKEYNERKNNKKGV